MILSIRPNSQLIQLFLLIEKLKPNLTKRSDILTRAIDCATLKEHEIDWKDISKLMLNSDTQLNENSLSNVASFWQLPVDDMKFNTIINSMSNSFGGGNVRKNYAVKLILHYYYHSLSNTKKTIKIISFNVNDFGGAFASRESYKKQYGTKSYLREWDNINKSYIVGGITTYIAIHNPEIFLIHEFDVNSSEGKQFQANMEKLRYDILYTPNSMKRPSITAMFVKKSITNYKIILNSHKKFLRAMIIELDDLVIYGVHCPYDISFWDELINQFKSFVKSGNQVLLMGDLNVFDKGTTRMQKFEELLNFSSDLWLNCGKNHQTPTCSSGRRIDYAISSHNAIKLTKNMKIDDLPLNLGLSDHCSLILELER